MKPINLPFSVADDSHEQVQLLLPWYVNRTLSREERMLVETHLQGCAECRSVQDELHGIAAQVRCVSIPQREQAASLQSLMQRINANDIATKQPAPGAVRKLLNNALRRPRLWTPPLPLALAAALLLLVLMEPLGFRFEPDASFAPDAAYRTLSSGNVMHNSGSRDLNVIFADSLDMERRVRLLTEVHGEIVEGPSARGVYRVRIAALPGANQDIAGVLAVLRKERGVLFAEPAQAPQATGAEGGSKS